MRKTKTSISSATRKAQTKRKLPKKNTRKKSSVKTKKKTVKAKKTSVNQKKVSSKKVSKATEKYKKTGKLLRVKKTVKTKRKKTNIKKLDVSSFALEKKSKHKVSQPQAFKSSVNNVFASQHPIINFKPNFLDNSADVDELLNQVEINDQDSVVIEDINSKEDNIDIKKNNELEKLINADRVLAENIIGNSNYSLKIKENNQERNIAVRKSKTIQKKSQYLVNLRRAIPEKNTDDSETIISNSNKFKLQPVKKRTIKSLSILYFRELLFLSSRTKFFKFTHFLGKNIAIYCFYLILAIKILLKFISKSTIDFLFSILVAINSFGKKTYEIINHIGKQKELDNPSYFKRNSQTIISWKKKVLNFNPFLVFKNGTSKTYVRILSFIFICLLIITSVQVMALVGKFNSTRGKILGISEQAFSEFNDGVKSITNSNFDNAQNSFSNANQKFSEAEKEILEYNAVFVDILKIIPKEGKKLDYGIRILKAGRLFSEVAQHISSALDQENKKLTLTDKIKLISNNLIQSKKKLTQVSKDLASIDEHKLPKQYREQFLSIQKAIPLIINNLDELDSVVEVISDILGADGPKRYLIVFQNSNELRPTGGFMGSLAVVDVQKGEIKNIKVPAGGPYDLKAGFFENIISPKPLWLVNPNLNFWDTNWFADFPTSAELMLKYWEKSGGPTVDGVVAINSNLMLEFLKIIGPLDLKERGLKINADNFIRNVQEIVEIKDAGQAPKAIIGEMMSKILDKVFKDRNLNYLQILKLFATSMKNKDIQIYFPDASLESTINNYAWGGAMTDTSGDYLAVINTNIGGYKTDEFVKEKLDHYVNILSNGTIIDTLKINRSFIAEEDNPFSKATNRTYLRVYVPQGAKLLEATGFESFPEKEYMTPVYGSQEDEQIKKIQGRYVIDELSGVKINSEFNKTVFSGWQELKPGQKKVIVLKYELPFKLNLDKRTSILDKFFKQDKNLNLSTYTIVYEKQSGKSAELNLTYHWSNQIKLVWSNISKNSFQIPFNSNKIIGFILRK